MSTRMVTGRAVGDGVWDVAGRTDVGRARANNQDQFLIARLSNGTEVLASGLATHSIGDLEHERTCLLCAVADGVGGTDAGALASGTAIRSLIDRATAAASISDEAELVQGLEKAVAAAHAAVLDQTESGSTAATTLTLALLIGPRAYVLHVGDSRLYWLRAGNGGASLKRVTRDQTLGESMIDRGDMTEKDLSRSPFRNVLVQAIGAHSAVPTIRVIDPLPGDALLLCSDGLTGHIEDQEIEERLRSAETADSVCQELVDRANEEGGLDNITIVVARWLEENSAL